jgi:universal bacterial protein YeaZ
MLILSLESSAKAVSAALVKDGDVIGEYFINTKQTHSETLMPMIESLLSTAKITLEEVDLFAVSAGPGSFTGVRIGIATVKGMAFPSEKPCCAVSTLEAIAWGGIGMEGDYICAVMDARCNQVYNALFRIENGTPKRLCEDRPIAIDELCEECGKYGDKLVLMGDGAELCYESFKNFGAKLSAKSVRLQKASSVAFAAGEIQKKGEYVSAEKLVSVYLRLSQAERERKKKLEDSK